MPPENLVVVGTKGAIGLLSGELEGVSDKISAKVADDSILGGVKLLSDELCDVSDNKYWV